MAALLVVHAALSQYRYVLSVRDGLFIEPIYTWILGWSPNTSSKTGVEAQDETINPASEVAEAHRPEGSEMVSMDQKSLGSPGPNAIRRARQESLPNRDDVEKNVEADGGPIQPMTSPNHDQSEVRQELPLSKAGTIALVVTVTGSALLNTLSVQAAIIVYAGAGLTSQRSSWSGWSNSQFLLFGSSTWTKNHLDSPL